jgi:hypothetical protein
VPFQPKKKSRFHSWILGERLFSVSSGCTWYLPDIAVSTVTVVEKNATRGGVAAPEGVLLVAVVWVVSVCLSMRELSMELLQTFNFSFLAQIFPEPTRTSFYTGRARVDEESGASWTRFD